MVQGNQNVLLPDGHKPQLYKVSIKNHNKICIMKNQNSQCFISVF